MTGVQTCALPILVKISDDYKVDKEFAPLIDRGELFQLIMDDINDS